MSRAELSRKQKMLPTERPIIAWVFITLAILTAGLTLNRATEKFASASWPQVSAEVLSSEMYQRKTQWCFTLRYRYIVNNQEYISNRISTSGVGDQGCNRDKAITETRIALFKSNIPIEIHYKPEDPSTGVLYPGKLDVLDYFFLIVAAIFFVGGLAALRR